MYRLGVLVPTADFKEEDHLEAKAFYMLSLNGSVKKCPHGLFDLSEGISEHGNRCKYCHAKLLQYETSNLCCANGQIKCEGEKWQIKKVRDPPQLLKDLLCNKIDAHFKQNIRKYNNALAMASIGISEEIVQKGFSPNVKIHGNIYHLHGSLFPEGNEPPKFAQIVVYDGNLEKEAMYLSQLKRRMEVFGGEKNTKEYDKAKAQLEVCEDTMAKLQECLHKINTYYLTYKSLGINHKPCEP